MKLKKATTVVGQQPYVSEVALSSLLKSGFESSRSRSERLASWKKSELILEVKVLEVKV